MFTFKKSLLIAVVATSAQFAWAEVAKKPTIINGLVMHLDA